MLTRVLEPEFVDTPEDSRAYDDIDHTEVNGSFVDDLFAVCPELTDPDREEVRLLDLGTGPGKIPIEICRRSTSVRVLAVDMAISMLEIARYHVEIAGYRDQVALAQMDAKSLPFGEGEVEVILSNSIIHHLPDPVAAFDEAVRVLAPGGLLFFRDLLRPDSEEALSSLVNTYAGESDPRHQQLFADSLRAALTLEELREIAERFGFAADSVTATSDRHWTWSARKQNIV